MQARGAACGWWALVLCLVGCLAATAPAAIAFWSVCGIVNGIVAFDVAKDAVEAHVKGW